MAKPVLFQHILSPSLNNLHLPLSILYLFPIATPLLHHLPLLPFPSSPSSFLPLPFFLLPPPLPLSPAGNKGDNPLS